MRWRVKLNQLEAFRGVMLCGTTKHAAALMNVSQPAISRLIQDLEAQIGQPLFERSQGRLVPNAEAHLLYKESETTIAHLDHLDSAIRDIRRLYNTPFRIVAPPAIGYGLMPNVLERSRSEFGNLRASLRIAPRRQARVWLERQDFDLAVAMLPIDYPDKLSQQLGSVTAVCVCHASHRFASQSTVHARDFEGEDFISLLPETLASARLDKVFSDLGVNRNYVIDAQSGVATCLLARRKLGVGVIDPITASQFEDVGIVSRPFIPPVQHDYCVLFPTNRRGHSVTDRLVEIIGEELAKYP